MPTDACHWNNPFCSGLQLLFLSESVENNLLWFISVGIHSIEISFAWWWCKAIRAWLGNWKCVCVCVTGLGHGHTAWQTAMRSRLVLAHQMRRIPQNSSVTSLFYLEARGESKSLFTTTSAYIRVENGQKFTLMCWSRMFCTFSPPTHLYPPPQSHTVESLLLI